MVTTIVLVSILGGILIVGKINNRADWGHWATNILDGWIRVYCSKFHRLRNTRLQIPLEPHVLLAANHISGIDPFLLITATDRPIRFMIAKEEYERPLLNWMFRAAGCIPVDRSGRVEKAFRSALRAINSGELVALFPQGRIHREDQVDKAIKPGIVRLAQLSECPIFAVRIKGVGAPGTLFKSVFCRSQITFDTHPLISVEQASAIDFRISFAKWLLDQSEMID
ncbi:lysophospholipid acyltransferase family protein [Aliikangiella coralliicola]|uniref:1-acyl-sn-glycerol-3-phosphate acyltransferase n=1 Tax=Aliikangiella coralliicola TaxID=2592383 RepID=A0A545U0L3_9GAMM|nr:lysophospholipid acyltransferase family protein [Aliikangiella coralliicola]TQV82995.1 1-acyl-sn-glycerol-3-phosphate acyltransferase [Aliikangiella coralliicola]